jgi:structural maintenance of chromosome 2
MKALVDQYEWLNNIDVEFEVEDGQQEQQLEDLKKLRSNYVNDNKNLIRHINKRVEAVADNLENECKNLLMRKETVLQDKQNLIEILDECRHKKEETVMKTFEKVNKAINAIFSTLLPGTQARLKPVDENSILQEGVELSVAFNGIWKNSLNELSGGQRSLLALSFILAMMKYKPAPIYILDEIDAALDLENTQRIGEMIRKHFKNSQFLIVSLKEQMTFNATVIYRVSNVDGKSKVD